MKPDYENFIKKFIEVCRSMPHCDSYVLHKPGICDYCDMPKYAEVHKFRNDNGISYTGEKNGKWPCPSEQRRSLATINRWGGNVPSKG